MMRLHTRLGSSICLTLFSLTTIILLLPNSSVSVRLQSIALGVPIDHYSSGGVSSSSSGGLWGWASGDDDDLRVVVFGDSWADVPKEEASLGRGRSWAGVMCEEVNCTSHVSFATSQPLAEYPASPPTGALSSNSVYTTSLRDAGAGNVTWDFLLPDLAAQVQEFQALSSASSKKGAPREIIFALSFGFWDIFHFASLDYELAKTMVDAAVDELVHQIDILYSSYTLRRVDPEPQPPSDNESDSELLRPAAFRIAIPKLFDPSLVPGWLTQRSLPLFPTTVAEEQKHAFYLTERWNSRLENSLGSWVAEPESQEEKAPEEESAADAEAQKEAVVAEDGDEPKQTPSPPAIPKDVFFYDLPRYILDIIIEQHLQDEGLSDAEGLGKGETPFENVSQPCVDFSSEEDRDKDGKMTARKEFHGKTICADPKGHLFWDAFNIGAVANEGLGRGIAQMIREGARLGASS